MASMGASPKTWSETVVLPLVKYSRAWAPKPPHLVSDGATPTQASFQPTAPEWSHFTQPTLSLLIETIHSGSDAGTGAGRPSVDHEKRILLKFMWDNNPQPAPSQLSTAYATSNAGAFLLEQIDLNEVVERFAHRRAGEVPLKAICKDCVLGIRYATGYLGSSLAFNRLQIKFHNQVDCLKFVGIIETICPCKMSATMESSQDLDYSSQKRPTNTSTQAHLNSRESSSPACEKEASVATIKSKTTMQSQSFSNSPPVIEKFASTSVVTSHGVQGASILPLDSAVVSRGSSSLPPQLDSLGDLHKNTSETIYPNQVFELGRRTILPLSSNNVATPGFLGQGNTLLIHFFSIKSRHTFRGAWVIFTME
ncbi:hypothetical protein O181_029951 [Austropuccinia psidii MF-1]|uniref:Uncharacterized protein n=1 Tax=Austropuccinia psidii MF-1 TaxID=1389203 RepID=A0A9Q3CXI0_9BASI|nr:hypothetical protein [Austropuccinia psidii MF-1]